MTHAVASAYLGGFTFDWEIKKFSIVFDWRCKEFYKTLKEKLSSAVSAFASNQHNLMDFIDFSSFNRSESHFNLATS